MLGLSSLGTITKLLSDKNALGNLLKEQAPTAIDALLQAIAKHAGAAPDQEVAITLYHANTPTGGTTIARVRTVDAFGEEGEVIGEMDLRAALDAIPSDQLADNIKNAMGNL